MHTHTQFFPGFSKWKKGEIQCFWMAHCFEEQIMNSWPFFWGQGRVREWMKGQALPCNKNSGKGSQMILSFLIYKVGIKHLLCLSRKIIYICKSFFSGRFFPKPVSQLFYNPALGHCSFFVLTVVPRDTIIHIFSLILNALWLFLHLFRSPHLKEKKSLFFNSAPNLFWNLSFMSSNTILLSPWACPSCPTL